ncbi:MAG: response regulator [bacterium]|nr:MAG: response regulator [bacterium]
MERGTSDRNASPASRIDAGADLHTRILVVEDNRVTNDMVKDFLRERNYRVDQAFNGSEALQMMARNSYDIVISDIVMPGMDGIEFLKRVKSIKPDQEVIMVTSSVDISHSIEAIKLQAMDYILKPIDFKEFDASIRRALERLTLGRLQKEHRDILEFKMIEEGRRAQSVFFDAVQSLINAIEARDSYTRGHSQRVTRYTELITEVLQLPGEAASEIRLAAQLHDIGKLGMSDFVLSKSGKLTEEEFDLIRKHPDVGYAILQPILPGQALLAVRHHHERWDGGGYPHGLAGEEIPLSARIIALADAFDAMTSRRVYRSAMNTRQARDEILRCSGSQFDPALVELAQDLIARGKGFGEASDSQEGGSVTVN